MNIETKLLIALALLAPFAAVAATSASDVLATDVRDGKAPAWAVAVASPPGWTRDCCTYAKANGVDAVLYQGSDHIDDAVVFCDPGAASGIRLSWSMSFADADPAQRPLLDAFMQVATDARYERYTPPPAAKKP